MSETSENIVLFVFISSFAFFEVCIYICSAKSDFPQKIYSWTKGGVTFHSLLVTRRIITRYSFQNLLVTRCRSFPLQKITRYSCKIRSFLLAEVAGCKKSLVTRWKIRSLLVAEVVRCKNLSTPTKKLNKDTPEISVTYILPMYPLSLTLSTPILPVQKPSR